MKLFFGVRKSFVQFLDRNNNYQLKELTFLTGLEIKKFHTPTVEKLFRKNIKLN
jgi:hypothetical protein